MQPVRTPRPIGQKLNDAGMRPYFLRYGIKLPPEILADGKPHRFQHDGKEYEYRTAIAAGQPYLGVDLVGGDPIMDFWRYPEHNPQRAPRVVQLPVKPIRHAAGPRRSEIFEAILAEVREVLAVARRVGYGKPISLGDVKRMELAAGRLENARSMLHGQRP